MPRISRRQMVGGLLSWQLVAKPRPAAADQARFRLLEKALWVWKDRISAPGDLEAFTRTNGIRTLFLYTTPEAAEALLSGDSTARGNLLALKGAVREIYAMAGEPDWAFGPQKIPEHVDLLLRLQGSTRGLFDGLHLDVEPNAMPEWRDPAGKQRLIEGTLQFYDLVRRRSPEVRIDAAVNPVFSQLRTVGQDNFLSEIGRRVHSASIMAYRNRVQSIIDWATPAMAQFATTHKGWRIGVEVNSNDSEPGTSWSRVPADKFLSAMVELDGRIRQQAFAGNYTSLAIHSFDGMKALLA